MTRFCLLRVMLIEHQFNGTWPAMPCSWQLCILSDRLSVITPPTTSTPSSQITHSIHFGSLNSSCVKRWAVDWTLLCDALDKHHPSNAKSHLGKGLGAETVRHGRNLIVNLMGLHRIKTAMRGRGSARETSKSLKDNFRWHHTHLAQW